MSQHSCQKSDNRKLEHEFLRSHRETPRRELLTLFNERFGRAISADRLTRLIKEAGAQSSTWPKVRAGRVGAQAPNFAGEGKIRVVGGYQRICRINAEGKAVWPYLHRDTWERANGPVPDGYRLVCLGDTMDARIENWVLAPFSCLSRAFKGSAIPWAEATPDERRAMLTLAQITKKLEEKDREKRSRKKREAYQRIR